MKEFINHIKNLKKEDKIMVFLIFTTIGNIIITITKFIVSLILPSLWFFINGLFMFILTLSRFFSIRDYSITKIIDDKDKIIKIGYQNYLTNGILLIILGIMYYFVNVYIYYKGTNTTIHPYMTYLVALIAFWQISSSIYGMIKYQRNTMPIIKAVKLTSFASSLTSIMLTQIVLLDTYATTKDYNSNLMNGITGMSIGLIIIVLGLYMIIGINNVNKNND